MDSFVNTGGHSLKIIWLSGDMRFSCLSNVSYVVDLSRVTKSLLIDFFRFAGTSFATVIPRLWTVIKMRCNESTIYISALNSKGNIFFRRLRTATCWLALRQILRIWPSNLSLLSGVTPRSSSSFWTRITVPSQVNTGFLSTPPKVIAWYFEWFLLFDWIHTTHQPFSDRH